MNIAIFNRKYTLRRYGADGTYEDSVISVHLHASENGGGSPWPETKGIVRQISGHGMVPLREADLAGGTRADRVLYSDGRWYECTSCVLYDHTSLAHYNYSFIVVPEDVVDTITIFNAVLDPDKGYDLFIPTVIKGVSWLEQMLSTQDNIGVKEGSKYTIQVPEEADFSGRTYVEPHLYTGARGTFTFNTGDIIIRGVEWNKSTPAELRKKYGRTVKVMGVFDFRTAPNARHWKLEGE